MDENLLTGTYAAYIGSGVKASVVDAGDNIAGLLPTSNIPGQENIEDSIGIYAASVYGSYRSAPDTPVVEPNSLYMFSTQYLIPTDKYVPNAMLYIVAWSDLGSVDREYINLSEGGLPVTGNWDKITKIFRTPMNAHYAAPLLVIRGNLPLGSPVAYMRDARMIKGASVAVVSKPSSIPKTALILTAIGIAGVVIWRKLL